MQPALDADSADTTHVVGQVTDAYGLAGCWCALAGRATATTIAGA